MRTFLFTAIFLTMASAPALADGFRRVQDKDGFLSVVEDRELRRLGIRLIVTRDGRIVGKAFGKSVSGDWRWDGGYFCRDLSFGGDELGFNCQLVQVKGSTVRFTSDKGQGMYADLKID